MIKSDGYDSLSGLVYDVMTVSEKNYTAFPSAYFIIFLLVIPFIYLPATFQIDLNILSLV